MKIGFLRKGLRKIKGSVPRSLNRIRCYKPKELTNSFLIFLHESLILFGTSLSLARYIFSQDELPRHFPLVFSKFLLTLTHPFYWSILDKLLATLCVPRVH